jgi:D-alanyl-D-alanine endopeptidase (penicillin-binding protein 7)
MRFTTIIKWLVAVLFVAAVVWFSQRIVYSGEQKVVFGNVPSPLPSDAGIVLGEEQPETKTLHAKAGVVVNANTGKVLYAENAFEELPMASITKLMSSMVALDNKIDLRKVVTIPPDDYTIGGNLRIVAGRETVMVKDLFYASITGSANNAALTIAKLTNLTAEDFVAAMNRKSVELKLESLHFQEASGLSPQNTGSAYDIAQMAGYAFSHYPLILDAASQKQYEIITQNTKRQHLIKNPDGLFESSFGQFAASKTGYLDEALYCLVLAKKTPGGMIVAVTLGNPSKEDSENETMQLLQKGERMFIGANH